MEDLFNVAGEEFYFDLDRIGEFIKLEKQENLEDLLKTVEIKSESDGEDGVIKDAEYYPKTEDSYGPMVDITKWEMTKAMVEVVLSEQGDVDETMGFAKLESQLSIPFKISFNTLLINKIVKKYE